MMTLSEMDILYCCRRSLLMRDRAIALGTIIVLFGIWCEGISLFMPGEAIARYAICRSLCGQ
ncbi:hypothetical protein QT989_10760 [Microcoleus sp. SVA1_B6]|uniref:hypothetical protein n=1 Tax=Microcoleus sp. SVA1_B6 TaxID=2818952 RepID=UPI002FCFEC30